MNNRNAKNGYWKCTGGESSMIDADGQTVAYKQAFAFREITSPTRFDFRNTNWIMDEFRLCAPHAGDDGTGLELELVCCRIFKTRFEGQTQPQEYSDPDSDADPTLPDPIDGDTDSDPPAVSESDVESQVVVVLVEVVNLLHLQKEEWFQMTRSMRKEVPPNRTFRPNIQVMVTNQGDYTRPKWMFF